MWLRWIIDQPRVIFPSPFFSCFTQTEWFRPPHWSRAVVYERINHSTEDTICFSLWDKGKLSMVCETESIPAFVENVYEFIKTTKKKTQMDNYICVFGLLLWFCLYNCLGASWSRTKKRNEGGGVLPFFFLFSFFYFVLSLSLSIFRTKPRSETLTTQAKFKREKPTHFKVSLNQCIYILPV